MPPDLLHWLNGRCPFYRLLELGAALEIISFNLLIV